MDESLILKLGTITFPLSIFVFLNPGESREIGAIDLEAGIDGLEWKGIAPSGLTFEEQARELQGLCADRKVNIRLWVIRKDNKAVVRVGLEEDDEGVKWSGQVKRLRVLFDMLENGWEGNGDLMSAVTDEEKNLDMLQLYSNIESPAEITEADITTLQLEDQEVLRGLTLYENPKGVKTRLHHFQLRSTSRMILTELAPPSFFDPTLSAYTDAAGEAFYVALDSGRIYRKAERYSLSRGGILCESMGVGKTAICLNLILSTKHQTALHPLHHPGISHVTSIHRLRTRPTADDQDLIVRTSGLDREIAQHGNDSDHASGSELGEQEGREDFKPLVIEGRAFLEFYYRYPDLGRHPRKVRQVTAPLPTRVYLSKTTLVVVPSILASQWLFEVEKHLERNVLSVHVVRQKKDWKCIEELIAYDMIIIDFNCFEQEGNKLFGGLDPWNTSAFRRGMKFDRRSVLLEARWKRLILDEGAIAQSRDRAATNLVRRLEVDYLWLVSGTPTRNLKQGDRVTDGAYAKPLFGGWDNDEDDGDVGTQPATSGSSTGTSNQPASLNSIRRCWSQKDADDAQRFGNMLSGFLRVEPFCLEGSRNYFSKYITGPLCHPAGPRYNAVQRISELMCHVMIKHQAHDVDAEVTVPPLTIHYQRVALDPMQKLTYNVIMALIVYQDICGCDIRGLENRLTLSTTWSTNKALDLEWPRNVLSRRLCPVKSAAVAHIYRAPGDPAWKDWSQHGTTDVPVELLSHAVPSMISDAWADSPNHAPRLISADSIGLLRHYNRLGFTTRSLAQAGWESRVAKQQDRAEYIEKRCKREMKRWFREERHTYGFFHELNPSRAALERLKDYYDDESDLDHESDHEGDRCGFYAKGDGESDDDSVIDDPYDESSSDEEVVLEDVVDGRKRTLKNKDYRSARWPQKAHEKSDVKWKRLRAEWKQRQVDVKEYEEGLGDQSHLPRPLPDLITVTTKSSKVNYVLRAIFEAPEDKFIIFGVGRDLDVLARVLLLAGIDICQAGAMTNKDERQRQLIRFSDVGVRAFLLDLSLAARGLTLVMANRMIFLSPVKDKDVKAQAIKRIHRIGQTRKTKVEILVGEGTHEEEIARREAQGQSEGVKDSWLDYLRKNPRFVETCDPEPYNFAISLTPPASNDTEVIVVDDEGEEAEEVVTGSEVISTTTADMRRKTIAEMEKETKKRKALDMPGPRNKAKR